MGSTADLCGIVKEGVKQPDPITPSPAQKVAADPLDNLKQAFSNAYEQGFEDQMKRVRFLLKASGYNVKQAEELPVEELPVEELPIEDEAAVEETTEDAIVDESGGDQDSIANALIEKLLQTIEDPTVAEDTDRESVLESANLFEDEELKEGKKTASVNELLEARLNQYFQMFGWEE